MTAYSYSAMFMLAGEQAAPNLLPARHFNVKPLHIFHSDFPKSQQMAERTALRLSDLEPQLQPVDAYDLGTATKQMRAAMQLHPNALVNVTGGTKPMSIAALLAAREAGHQAFYVRSGAETNIDLYQFDGQGLPYISESLTITNTISLDDYLVAYFGDRYQFTGIGGTGLGRAFEEAIWNALQPPAVGEIQAGWKHESGAVDIDFVLRCNNQIGIIEAKTGQKARTTDGIKQLAVAGGQRFFGTYVKRFLVIDQSWEMNPNNRELAEAIGITLVELSDFTESDRKLSDESQEKLIKAIHNGLGKPYGQ